LQPKPIALEPKIVVNLQVEADIVNVVKKVAQNAKQVKYRAKKEEKLHRQFILDALGDSKRVMLD
jgi:hypothetical protein